MKRFLLLMAVAVFTAASVPAQTTQKDVLLNHWKASGDFALAVAEAMPADSYSFRPVPEEMSFGDLMAHISVANRNACALAGGLSAPELPPKVADWLKDHVKVSVDKDTAVQFMRDTFAFCYRAITEVPPARLDTVVGPPNRNLTGTEWLWSYFTHTAHHRGQAEVYLRLKGIKPPAYAF